MTARSADGLRLAISWLSVFPTTANRVDARTTRQAIALAPLVGAFIGAVVAFVLALLQLLNAPDLLAGVLAVAVSVLLTRGMHVDGLADTVDALGCYGSAERALGVMRDGSTGPFAVTALILVLGTQAVSLSSLGDDGMWLAVLVAYAVGRAGFVMCCYRSIPAARPDGMGSLVASTQSAWVVAGWWTVLLVLATIAAGMAGALGVILAGAALLVFLRHVRGRFGGVTGDVLGASSEFATTIALALAAFT